MVWIFIILYYLVISGNQVNATRIKKDDMLEDILFSAEFLITGNGPHMDICWKESNQPRAIKIESLNKTCKICWKFKTINITTNPTNISIEEDHECPFVVDCPYKITLVSKDGLPIWNKTLILQECINDHCLCKKDSGFPKFEVEAECISEHNIKIYWFINIKEMIINSSLSNREMNNIKLVNISVFNLTIPELEWGGEQVLIKNNTFPINTNTQDVQDYWKLNLQSTFLPKHVFLISANIIDSNNCTSHTEYFKLIIAEKSGFKTELLLAVTIVLVVIILIVILKLIQKSKLTIWKNRYHIIGARPINHIPMESNILYIDRDNMNSNDDDFEICPSNVTLRYEIGRGAFGKVYQGFLKLENGSTMIVAIKLLKKSTYADLEEEFLNEVETMKNVGKHNNIIELFGFCTKQPPMMMIMEFVVRGDLLKYLERIRRKQPNFKQNDDEDSFGLQAIKGEEHDFMISGDSGSYITQPDPDLVRPSLTDTLYTNLSGNNDEILNCEELHNFALQIAEGMSYLEQKEITHRDLAARNILISDNKVLKISDFGLSRNGNYIKRTQGKIPWKWLSIEAMVDHFYSSKSDVWSFGVVLWEIGSLGQSPYPDIETYSALLKYLKSGNRLNKPNICSDDLYNLMCNCWKADLTARPSFSDILNFLRPEGKHLYIQLNSLGSNYVFPPLIT